jgi:hypothetical protein
VVVLLRRALHRTEVWSRSARRRQPSRLCGLE